MKLFIASDIHGCAQATEKLLQRFDTSGAKHLLLLGDILNHGPRNAIPKHYNPILVAKQLNQYKHKIMCVRGNCDSEVDQMLLEFPIMSDFAWIMLEQGQRLFATHGHIYNQNKLPLLAEGDVLLHGHTHIRQAEKVQGIHVINPGSVTIPRQDNIASYALLESTQVTWYRLDDSSPLSSYSLS